MRVAYLVNQYPQPSHTFIVREIAALEALGVTVDRYTLRMPDRPPVNDDDRAERGKTTAILDRGGMKLLGDLVGELLGNPGGFFRALGRAWRHGGIGERGRLIHLIYLAEACALKRTLSDAKHVHAHFGTNSAEVALLCRTLGGPPFSVTVHGPEEFDRPRQLNLTDKIAGSKFVVGVSSFGRSQLSRWADFGDWDKIQVVHCGVNGTFLPPAGEEPTPVPDVPEFCSVGRLSEQKGQLVLIEACRLLKADGHDFKLHLVGDGELRPVVERRIAEAGLGGQVILHGVQPPEVVRERMLAARAFVLPSFAEGLPVVLMEALALGRPCITTYVAGIPELVRPMNDAEEGCGWLVPAADARATADAMADCLDTPADRLTAAGRAGCGRVRARHDAATEAGKLLKLIEDAA